MCLRPSLKKKKKKIDGGNPSPVEFSFIERNTKVMSLFCMRQMYGSVSIHLITQPGHIMTYYNQDNKSYIPSNIPNLYQIFRYNRYFCILPYKLLSSMSSWCISLVPCCWYRAEEKDNLLHVHHIGEAAWLPVLINSVVTIWNRLIKPIPICMPNIKW